MTHVRGGAITPAGPFLSSSDSQSLPTPPAGSLRVALFSGNYNYVRDGANQTLNRLVSYLLTQNVAVRVYSPTVAEPAFPPAGDLVSIPSVPIPRRREYRLGLGLPRRVRGDLAAFAPTLIHVSSPDLTGLAALRYADMQHLPAVASYHTRFETYLRYYGLGACEPMAIAFLRSFYRRCAQLYVPTDSLAQRLRELGFNDDVRIWSRGVDRARFSPTHRDNGWRAMRGFHNDDMVIGFVGRLVREKGLDLLAQIADGLVNLQVPHRFLIVGDGPDRPWLQQRLPAAAFTGHLDGDALSRAYASADVFLNPSTTETFGNVTLEAMASSLPTLCALATGSQSIVRDGTTGFLLDPARPGAFVAALARLAVSPALRTEMGRAARAETTAYSWETIMAGLVTHYRDAVAAGRRVRRHDVAAATTGNGRKIAEGATL